MRDARGQRAGPPLRPPLRVQIVEDERIVAWDLQTGLEQLGYEVVGIASSVEAADRMAQEQAPDLVLMDIHLDDGGDGIEAARRIRARDATPVIFLTAYGEPEVLVRAAAVAPHGYLLKPFELRELNASIEMAIVRREAERRTEQTQRRLQLALESAALSVLEIADGGRLRWSGEPLHEALRSLAGPFGLERLVEGLDEPGRRAFDGLLGLGLPVDLVCRWQDHRRPAEAPRWLELHARRFDAEGLTMGMLRDVTARIEGETRLRQALVVYDATSEAILFLDADCRVLDCNAAFVRNTGWTLEQVRGSRPDDFLYARRHGDRGLAEPDPGTRPNPRRGETTCCRADGSRFPALEHLSEVRDEHGRVSHHVLSFSDISEIRDTQFKLRHQAMHDALTGLGNRLYLQEALLARTASPQQARFGLLYIDLDGFKTINDTLGHDQGDQLLMAIARRLEGLLRSEDLIARLGGDEFVVLMSEPKQVEDAFVLAGKLRATIAQPVQLGDAQTVSLTASIGVALWPEHAGGAHGLLKAADSAMYAAKARGRNRAAVFEQSLSDGAAEHLRLEQGLRRAIELGQLSLDWQPVVDLDSGRVRSAEALLRWRHPELGQVAPQRFIPLAEATGLILPIGAWVLDQACAQAAAWLHQGVELERVAVNVSMCQFEQEDMLHQVKQALHRHGLAPQRLEIEVTESLFGSGEPIRKVLAALRELGVAISLDDFGTGYSSLAQLKSLPMDRLKVDRSFVVDISEDERSRAVVRTVVTLAQSLGLEITAEGVETQVQRQALHDLGVQDAQGWLFHRAMPAEQLGRLLPSTLGVVRTGG